MGYPLKDTIKVMENKNISIKSTGNPDYYVDGVKVDNAQMKDIAPNNIESVHVYKGTYGTAGRVEIKLKKKN